MHYGRYQEHKVFGMITGECASAKSNCILEDIIVEKLMHDDVPLAIIACKIFDIPPIFVKLAIGEPDQLCKHIHPVVKHSVK